MTPGSATIPDYLAGLYGALASLPLEVDILVYTPQEVREWSEVGQAFVTTATRAGVVVYERAARPRPRLVAEG